MARKRLTNKQRATIRRQQQQSFLVEPSQLSEPKAGVICCRHSNQAIIMDDNGNQHRCHLRSNIGNLVVGDRVMWRQALEPEQLFISEFWDANQLPEAQVLPIGIVEQCLERQTLIQRPDHRDNLRPIAANISQVIVVVATQPSIQPQLLDRYLIAIENIGLKIAIVLNKIDLTESLNQTRALLTPYSDAGYSVIELSALQDTGSPLLATLLHDENSIFVGQSGTGKSSLINSMIADADAITSELSLPNNRGKHTTTQSRLYRINRSTSIIDSPGIREFGLAEFNQRQLIDGFREFKQVQTACKFRDCRHLQEPGCAILQAVEAGLISRQRWKNYRYLYLSLTQKN